MEDTQIKESAQTKKLFDKAVIQLSNMLDSGRVDDMDYADVVKTAFIGHIKMRNIDFNSTTLPIIRHIQTLILKRKF